MSRLNSQMTTTARRDSFPAYPQGTILDPFGNPFPRRYDDYPIPKVIQFSGLVNSAWRLFYHEKHDWAMQHSREDAMAMRRDESLMCLLNERRRWTMTRKFHVKVPNEKDPREKYLKDGLTKILELTPYFRKMLWYLSDACWYGRQGSQIRYVWQEINLPKPRGGKVVQAMTPTAPVSTGEHEKRRVLMVYKTPNDDGHMQVNGDKIGHSYANEPYVLVNPAGSDQLPPGLPVWWSTQGRAMPLRGWMREHFVLHRWVEGSCDADFFAPQEADQINGVGIRSFIYFCDFLKKEWLASMCDWIERAGIGVKVFYYEAGNEASRKEAEKAAKSNLHTTNILIPRSSNSKIDQQGFEFIEPSGSGIAIIHEMIAYVDRWHERFIIGQSMSGGVGRGSGGKGGSGHGSGLGGSGWAEMASETKSAVEESDAVGLAETMTWDFLRVIQKYSFPEYMDIPAQFEFAEDKTEPMPKLEAAKMAYDMDCSLIESEVVLSAGYSIPTEGDKILKRQEPEVMGGEGGGKPGEKKPAKPDKPKE